jgi:hypothetical protein
VTTDSKVTSARAFVRSLNILLKFSRLYGFDHGRTSAQFETAWKELRAAIPFGAETGLLLGYADDQLLLDGMPMGSSPAERSFAQLLHAASVASIQFTPKVTREEFERLVRGFPISSGKPADLSAQMKQALDGATGVRINELRFVVEDPAMGDLRTAAQLTARTLGVETDDLKAWLSDPQKLLQLIAAAQGTHPGSGGPGGEGTRAGSGNGGSGGAASLGPGHGGAGEAGDGSGRGSGGGSGAGLGGGAGFGRGSGRGGASGSGSSGFGSGLAGRGGTGSRASTGGTEETMGNPATVLVAGIGEEDLVDVLKVLTTLGRHSTGGPAPGGVASAQREIAAMPGRNRELLRSALSQFANISPGMRPTREMLVNLAEHLAIRFALERYERGEVKVNAVRQTLDRMNKEIDALRNILGKHEETMAKAGMQVESHVEMLDRQFWASVPESGKRSVLLSTEAWCIPPRNVRSYLKEVIGRGDLALAVQILATYASCISNEDPEARRRTSMGLAELADLYLTDEATMIQAIRSTGAAMSGERDPDIEPLINAAFVRLSQEAASKHCYPALHQALLSLDGVENQRPAAAHAIRPRIGIEDRLWEFLEDAARNEQMPEGLIDVLRMVPHLAVSEITTRFNRAAHRVLNDRLAALAAGLGDEALTRLREILQVGAPADSVEAIGLLSRLDPGSLEQRLPQRFLEWPIAVQGRAVRVLASAGAVQRGLLLMELYDNMDPLVRPFAMDEIGMCGDASLAPWVAHSLDTEGEKGADFVRLKAIEALGRLRAVGAKHMLERIVEEKRTWRRGYHDELRIAALQAAAKIDPEWAEAARAGAGLEDWQLSFPPFDATESSSWYRQRRYQRLWLDQPVTAAVTNLSEPVRLEIKGLSLCGGAASCDRRILPGTHITLKIGGAVRAIRAHALMRDVRTQTAAFEFVSMELEDRSRLRRFLFHRLRPSDASPTAGLGSRDTFGHSFAG